MWWLLIAQCLRDLCPVLLSVLCALCRAALQHVLVQPALPCTKKSSGGHGGHQRCCTSPCASPSPTCPHPAGSGSGPSSAATGSSQLSCGNKGTAPSLRLGPEPPKLSLGTGRHDGDGPSAADLPSGYQAAGERPAEPYSNAAKSGTAGLSLFGPGHAPGADGHAEEGQKGGGAADQARAGLPLQLFRDGSRHAEGQANGSAGGAREEEGGRKRGGEEGAGGEEPAGKRARGEEREGSAFRYYDRRE